MAYTPGSTPQPQPEFRTRLLTPIELAGIKHLIKEWCGLQINLVDAGPSVSDPMGLVRQYVSFRDPYGNFWGIKIADSGKLEAI